MKLLLLLPLLCLLLILLDGVGLEVEDSEDLGGEGCRAHTCLKHQGVALVVSSIRQRSWKSEADDDELLLMLLLILLLLLRLLNDGLLR